MIGDLGVERPQSIRTLIEILDWIDIFLGWTVRRSGLIRSEFQPLFSGLWENTQTRITKAIQELESVDSKEHALYRALEDYGLTDESLELKVAIGRHLISELRESAFRTEQARDSAPRLFGISLKPALKWINVILGSLAKVLPILDAVKEYKEGVELTVENRESEPVWDPRILKL